MNIETVNYENSATGLAYKYEYRGASYTIFLSKDHNGKDRKYNVSVFRTKGSHVSLSVYFYRNGTWKTNEGRSMSKYMKSIIAFIESDVDTSTA